MKKLMLYYKYKNVVYNKDLSCISVFILISFMIILNRSNLNTLFVMCSMTCILSLIIYIRRLREIKKLESNMTRYHNYIIEMILDIDYLLKNSDVELIDNLSCDNLNYISERLAYYYENVENISDILNLYKVYIGLEKMKSDIILILNGEFTENTDRKKRQNQLKNQYTYKSDIIIGKYLKILELPKGTNDMEIIQAAYRRLSKKYHPDIDKSFKSKQKFEEIKDAYSKLKKYYK